MAVLAVCWLLGFQDCSDGIVYDDGTRDFDIGFLASTQEGIVVIPVTPSSYPYVINQVCVGWGRAGSADALDYEIVIYGDDGTPFPLLAAYPASAASIPTIPAFDFTSTSTLNANFQGFVIEQGTVFVGVRWSPNLYQDFAVIGDAPAMFPGWYSAANLGPWTLNTNSVLMIRVSDSVNLNPLLNYWAVQPMCTPQAATVLDFIALLNGSGCASP
ncbi:MAG: hypothetical protein H6510_16095 [Acidobacteria bacterium]|nr:hypothetical protein [Acidobacteriota bacterium]MCB9399335.1 hypothetical protein [Acidobacteriota bacterium]